MKDFEYTDTIIHNIDDIAKKYQEAMLYIIQGKGIDNFINNINIKKMDLVTKEVTEKILEHPEKFIEHNIEYGKKFASLLNNTMMRFVGENIPPMYSFDNKDKRFKDPSWHENIYFDFIRQSYLMSTEWVLESAKKLDLDSKMQKMLAFYAKQFTDALCPANFPLCNPEVIKESISSKWENISIGFDNFLADLKNTDGFFNINTTDKLSFKIGENIASTKGKIVFKNDLMELICYEPKEKIYQVPILIVPPWINKYYILDLSNTNSFVKWLVDNNFQVFLISWVNPGKSLSEKNFEDYGNEGILEALKYIKSYSDCDNINALGYCIGGTLLACVQSLLKSRNDDSISSATYITTLLDFENSGEVGLFINEETIRIIEDEIKNKGYFDGRYIANSFSLLRANDLIWSFFVNNYLLGRMPLPFDLLYWNSDPTNLPSKMYSFYLRNMYLENNLVKSDIVDFLGHKINLSKITTPSFFLGAKDDHIAPWQSVFAGMNIFSGEKEFCLSASGHVAGVVNPVSQNKYSYWVNQNNIKSSDEWISKAENISGSWWSYWLSWQKKYSGMLVEEKYYHKIKAIEKAPGQYVKVRI